MKSNTYQDCLNFHFILSTSISKHAMLTELKHIYIKMNTHKLIEENKNYLYNKKHHCIFWNKIKYATYSIIPHLLK